MTHTGEPLKHYLEKKTEHRTVAGPEAESALLNRKLRVERANWTQAKLQILKAHPQRPTSFSKATPPKLLR